MKRRFSEATLIVVTFVALGLMFSTYAAINETTMLNSSGTVISASSTIRLFSDSACTTPLTNLDWGTPSPGGTVTRIVYVKNTQETTSLELSMTAANWNPANANGPLTITWDRQGTKLAPGQSTEATLTLCVSPSETSITSFSVQIAISASTT